jgi:hypothetical protein
MTNLDVIKSFIKRNPNSTAHLLSTGDKLYSYSTCIAESYLGMLLVNITYYSNTTSHHLGLLKRNYPSDILIVCLDRIPQDTQNLHLKYERYKRD